MKRETSKRAPYEPLITVLAAAAGEQSDALEDLEAALRDRTIDFLESLGYIEARSGDPLVDEATDRYYVVAITDSGRCKLAELRARRDDDRLDDE
jgi:hypothetical protein